MAAWLAHFAHVAIFDFTCGVAVQNHTWLVAVEIDANVMPAVGGDDAWLSAHNHAAPDFSGYAVIVSNVIAGHHFSPPLDCWAARFAFFALCFSYHFLNSGHTGSFSSFGS